jgi:hypothetical protein
MLMHGISITDGLNHGHPTFSSYHPRREPPLPESHPESTPKPTNPAPAASIESDETNKQKKKKKRAIEGAGSPGGGKKLTGGAARSPGCGCPGNMGGCCATCCMSSTCCISCCCCAAAAACFILCCCCCGCMPATIARPRLLGFGRGANAPEAKMRKKPK